MEKNETPLNFEEQKSLNGFSWNFILFLFTFVAGLILLFGAVITFSIWLCRKVYQGISFFRFINYVTVVKISKEFRIVKSRRTGKYGLCENLSFVFYPRYKDIKLTPTDVLEVTTDWGKLYEVPFSKLARTEL